jgi:hypothetical protein
MEAAAAHKTRSEASERRLRRNTFDLLNPCEVKTGLVFKVDKMAAIFRACLPATRPL